MPRKLNYTENELVKSDMIINQSFNGAHHIKIIQCVTELDAQNKEYLDVIVQDIDTEKEYSIKRMYLDSNPDAKGNQREVFKRNIFNSLLGLLGITKLQIAKIPARTWNPDTREFEMIPREQYSNLIGKTVGAVMVHKNEYQRKFVNLYTGEQVEKNPALAGNPEYGYIPDLDTPMVSTFDLLMFFDWNTKLTLSEKAKGVKVPKAVPNKIKYAESITGEDFNIHSLTQYRLDLLKRQLSKAGQQYDESRFIADEGTQPYDESLF